MLDIIFEDEHILAINKPSGLVVNSSNTQKNETLQDILNSTYFDLFQKYSSDEVFTARNGIVHRLDKDTSGIILVAKTPDSFNLLQQQFKQRLVKKTYLTFLHGNLSNLEFEVNAPLKRNPNNRFKYAVVANGKPSTTKFTKLSEVEIYSAISEQNEVFTVAFAYPVTGRTHQIRVHTAALYAPVAGDVIYSPKNKLKISQDTFNRLMLHAYSLEFSHPINQNPLQILCNPPEVFTRYYTLNQ